MTSSAVPAPLHQRRPLVLADLIPGTLVRDILLVVGGAALTGVLAQIAIPVAGSPVPITGQTFGALTVGAVLGWQRGGLSMLLYLVAGMAGVNWFADRTSGFDIPSLGYIIGFVFAAALVGALASRGWDRTPAAHDRHHGARQRRRLRRRCPLPRRSRSASTCRPPTRSG